MKIGISTCSVLVKRFFPLLCLFYTSSALKAEDSSLVLGVGVGTLYYPSYIGSKTYNTLSLPLPYIRYKSDYLRIDEDGLSSNFLGINDLKIDLSLSGSLPADSQNTSVRNGMPNLDLTGEVGFQLIYKIYENTPYKLFFETPLRAVLSTDFSNIAYRGIITNPQLKLSINYQKYEWTFRSGLLFTDKVYNTYYYGVEKQYVTLQRSQYRTTGGFGGFRSRVGVSYKNNSWWAGAFISYYNINHAVFQDSPLVETKENVYLGGAIAYIFYTNGK